MKGSEGLRKGKGSNEGAPDLSVGDRLSYLEEQLQQLPRVFGVIDMLTQRGKSFNDPRH